VARKAMAYAKRTGKERGAPVIDALIPIRLCYSALVAVLGRRTWEVGFAVLYLGAAALLDVILVRAFGLLLLGLARLVWGDLISLLDVVRVGLGVLALGRLLGR
jgi:hypothetical protein